jgi:hypothetical protein
MTRHIKATDLGIDPSEMEEFLKGEIVRGKHGQRRRRAGQHIGAPLAFVTEVCLLTEGRAALVMALCVFRRVCVCDSWTVTLPSDELGPLGIDRQRKRVALLKLQGAGLIKVRNSVGRTARITLLWRPS